MIDIKGYYDAIGSGGGFFITLTSEYPMSKNTAEPWTPAVWIEPMSCRISHFEPVLVSHDVYNQFERAPHDMVRQVADAHGGIEKLIKTIDDYGKGYWKEVIETTSEDLGRDVTDELESLLMFHRYGKEFGDTVIDGIKLAYTEMPRLSSRLLESGYHEAGEGEAYLFEMECQAIDEMGRLYEVFWIYENIKGEELELDQFEYRASEVDRVLKL